MVAILANSSASAIDEMSGVTVEFAPSKMTQGVPTAMTVIVHNSNSLPLNITSINVQARQGQVWVQAAYGQHFNGTEGWVPAGGSAEIPLEGEIGLIGRCDLQINMIGSMGPDPVGGTLYSSTVVQPTEGPTVFGLEPLTLAAVIASVVVIAALVVYQVKRRR